LEKQYYDQANEFRISQTFLNTMDEFINSYVIFFGILCIKNILKICSLLTDKFKTQKNREIFWTTV